MLLHFWKGLQLGEMTDVLVVAVAPLAPEHPRLISRNFSYYRNVQAHFYYAPTRDSKSHTVEHVSSLNEACGDRRC